MQFFAKSTTYRFGEFSTLVVCPYSVDNDFSRNRVLFFWVLVPKLKMSIRTKFNY